MRLAHWAFGLGLIAIVRAWPQEAPTWRTGVHDPSGYLSDTARGQLDSACASLLERAGVDLAVSIERPLPGRSAELDRQVTAKLLAALEGASPGAVGRAVLVVKVADRVATAEVSEALEEVLPSDRFAALTASALERALAAGAPVGVANALLDLIGRLPLGADADAGSTAGDTAARWRGAAWLNPWWLVVLPTILFGALLARQQGRGRALWLTPLLLLLYTGLYLLLRFQPIWFMVLGATGVAPVLLWLGGPPVGLLLREAAWREPSGGWSLTRLGALGVGRW